MNHSITFQVLKGLNWALGSFLVHYETNKTNKLQSNYYHSCENDHKEEAYVGLGEQSPSSKVFRYMTQVLLLM